ncbi:hypothetical protein ADICYQ_2556 [Cyclobacterium qasimii M12-11B]|uniref:Uncharacterized protein n=1 Tax=Cyclobacterium qasimii M12-11B TaxID=641524 RepID=S7VEK6_9BACT|nr:hypothetical protein ADICYQ_2556 [Cyclobacterium qasimii M12-11B]
MYQTSQFKKKSITWYNLFLIFWTTDHCTDDSCSRLKFR